MNRDRIASIAILAFCAFFYYESFGISDQNLTGLEATFFPRMLLGLIAALALLLLVRSFLIKDTAVKKVEVNEESDGKSDGKSQKRWKVPVIFGLFALYILLIDVLGFTVSSFLFMTVVYFIAVASAPVKKTGKKHAVSIAFLLGVSVVMTFIFERFLQVYLPEGIFF